MDRRSFLKAVASAGSIAAAGGFPAPAISQGAAAKALRAPRDKLDKWLVNRNGLDIVQEFAVRAESAQKRQRADDLLPQRCVELCGLQHALSAPSWRRTRT